MVCCFCDNLERRSYRNINTGANSGLSFIKNMANCNISLFIMLGQMSIRCPPHSLEANPGSENLPVLIYRDSSSSAIQGPKRQECMNNT